MPMNITVVGTGYVGLVTGTCFAEVGLEVTCIDIDEKKISNLRKGISPIYEPGLEDLLQRNLKKEKLRFETSLDSVIDNTDVLFIAVGTPPDEDGSADLKYVLDVARQIGKTITHYILVVTKSTVPVGTSGKVRATIEQELKKRNADIHFDVASNPEFLKEGAAIDDFMRPDRIVVGVESEDAQAVMQKLYKPFTLNGHPVIFMDIASAELTKYAANSMLATRISFMNDIANLCELLGADVNMVRKGIGSDSRIGNKFLYAGIGYGGSCFPKDVKALIHTAEQNSYNLSVLKAVEDVNNRQKTVLFHKFKQHFNNDIAGKTVAMWGLSFKPQTDDMREAPSLSLVEHLLDAGCHVQAYDPVALNEAQRRLGNKITYCQSPYEALDNADALFLVTEWTEFRLPDLKKIKEKLKHPVVFDGRNIFDGTEMKNAGITCYSIGKKPL